MFSFLSNYATITNLRPSGYDYDFQELTNSSTNMPAKHLRDFVTKTQANGGYYLGRYEASKEEDGKVDSKLDKAAWVNIIQSNAATAAREMYSNSYAESDLINSYSWDTAIVFIQKYSGNSNYANKESINTGDTGKVNTGKAGDKVCNIHDMASNCREWSTEYYINADLPCVGRGGAYDTAGGYACGRSNGRTNGPGNHVSFRILLYVK